MGYAIYEDTVGIDPIVIHKDTCTYYTNRKPSVKTSKWHTLATLDEADKFGEKIANKQGCKRCDDCLDGARIVDPESL
ncbi:MAG: hypothetical protein ACREAL_07315 [Nitrosopumilaceae archaeon]